MGWIGIDHQMTDTPCLFCGAVPMHFVAPGRVPTHCCASVMNLAKAFHAWELRADGHSHAQSMASPVEGNLLLTL